MSVVELHMLEEDALPCDEVFSTGEVAALMEVSIDQVNYLAKCGLLRSSVRKASGQGSRRLFNHNDLRRALLVQKLRDAEWKPKQIATVLPLIAAALRDPSMLHTPILIQEGAVKLIVCRQKGRDLRLLDAARPGQYVMVIALETLEEETRQKLAKSK